MKKLFFLCVISVMCLAGCSSSKSPESTANNSPSDTQTSQSDNNKELPALENDQESQIDADTGATTSQKNALKEAKAYLKYSAFSYDGLIEQLEYEGYPHEDCVYAVDNCGADWFEQAVKCAETYLEYSTFSYSELIEQLEYEGFSKEQATHGAEQVYDNSGNSSSGLSASKQNALKSAQSYLKHSAFSYEGLIEQLEYEGYPREDCVYAVDNCGADWFEQAVKCAKAYLKNSSFSYSSLVDQLEYEGFTNEQAVHGAKQNGF